MDFHGHFRGCKLRPNKSTSLSSDPVQVNSKTLTINIKTEHFNPCIREDSLHGCCIILCYFYLGELNVFVFTWLCNVQLQRRLKPMLWYKQSHEMCGYLGCCGSSGPSSRHRNTPLRPWERAPQGPESNQLTGWGHRGPGTNSSDRAARQKTRERRDKSITLLNLWETAAAKMKLEGRQTERHVGVNNQKQGSCPSDVICLFSGLLSRQGRMSTALTVTSIFFSFVNNSMS